MTTKKPRRILSNRRRKNSLKVVQKTVRSILRPSSDLAQRAEFMVEGLATNTIVCLAFSSKLGTLDLAEAFKQILERSREITERNTKSQEAILAGQVISLNAIYTDLAIIARHNLSNAVVFERLMRLALKAQSNCRATAECLAAIQNPPPLFARQANIANGPQQINNCMPQSGPISEFPRAKENNSRPNKLLEANGKRLDGGSPQEAGDGDSVLETVATLNRTTNQER